MGTPAGPGATPPPPPPPYPPSPPPRTEPPRWAWWVGGIAIPLVGILVTVAFGGNNPPPTAAPAPGAADQVTRPASPTPADTPSSTDPDTDPDAAEPDALVPSGATPSASPSGSAASEVDLTAPDGYAEALSTMWGLAPAPCAQHEQQLIDLDDGTSRTETEDIGAVKDPGGAELLHWPETCNDLGDYKLRALPNTRVGLLRTDAPKTFDSCRAAAGSGFGALNLPSKTDRVDRGFVEGAALCSVTDKGAVAMAVIEHISGGSLDDVSVSGPLYVWPAAR
ncbi:MULTISPECIES: hypothetical protein [Streptomyces]|uniref:hypothetical protein n=1 Tax=Streptomyces TaxID=1883 RepID=UPI0004BF47C6|nr:MULTISPECIES: hypothetical protein [Streptomyces]KOU05293.1 hypothetical protein ADK88_18820 [Streptomyces sp. NRRL F-2295]KOU45989.1 hypothetical protein ADK56_31375 [Streptomyces sp. MMG1522]NEA09023.1 hypothetical protein [Streptomyces sp. SID10692]